MPDSKIPHAKAALRHLFEEAQAESPGDDQAPALTCAIVIRGMPNAISGSLSTTPWGGLRMLSRNGQDPGPGADARVPELVEQYFDYEDVMVVALLREVTATARPSIILQG